jgi:hypothetical protein
MKTDLKQDLKRFLNSLKHHNSYIVSYNGENEEKETDELIERVELELTDEELNELEELLYQNETGETMLFLMNSSTDFSFHPYEDEPDEPEQAKTDLKQRKELRRLVTNQLELEHCFRDYRLIPKHLFGKVQTKNKVLHIKTDIVSYQYDLSRAVSEFTPNGYNEIYFYL